MRLRHLLLGCACLALCCLLCPRAAQGYEAENLIGSVHDAGIYYFGSLDYLNQGADEVAAEGTHLIKVELDAHDLLNSWTSTNNAKYPWNSSWTAVGTGTTVLSIAQTPYFQTLFSNPYFNTYVITLYCPNIDASGGENDEYWSNGDVAPYSSSWASAETTQVQNLCANLLANYPGKTFILENWEADSALQGIVGGSVSDPLPVAANYTKNMAQWINSRALGVHNAMANKGSSTANCYCAYEVNAVKFGIEEKSGAHSCNTGVDDVLPNTSVDYASYSAYDSMMITSGGGEYSFANCVNWIDLHCPSTVIGYDSTTHEGTLASVGVGEFASADQYQTSSYFTTLAINDILPLSFTNTSNCLPYVMYWNIYDNDLNNGVTTAPQNGNDNGVKGYWMIKPDGTPAVAWHTWRWQCITTDSTRYSTTKIKAALTSTYTSAFKTTGLGTGWTTSAGSGFTITPGSNKVTMTLPADTGSGFPTCLCNLDIPAVTSGGLGLQPANGTQIGDYAEYTIDRSNTGFMGVRLFGSTSSTGSDDGSGDQPLATYTGQGSNGWTAISWTWSTEPPDNGFTSTAYPSPTYNFNTTNTLGMSVDSADGTFATVSYYLNGSYMGSYLYQTTSTSVDTLSLMAQDDNTSGSAETFVFGNVAIYQK